MSAAKSVQYRIEYVNLNFHEREYLCFPPPLTSALTIRPTTEKQMIFDIFFLQDKYSLTEINVYLIIYKINMNQILPNFSR